MELVEEKWMVDEKQRGRRGKERRDMGTRKKKRGCETEEREKGRRGGRDKDDEERCMERVIEWELRKKEEE